MLNSPPKCCQEYEPVPAESIGDGNPFNHLPDAVACSEMKMKSFSAATYIHDWHRLS
jgi:hypothetical protein